MRVLTWALQAAELAFLRPVISPFLPSHLLRTEHAEPEPVCVDRRDVADAVGREGVCRARRTDHPGKEPLAPTRSHTHTNTLDHLTSHSLSHTHTHTHTQVIAEGDEEPNDTFLEQLVDGAKAAIDECVRRGVVDPKRCSVGGHSYGEWI